MQEKISKLEKEIKSKADKNDVENLEGKVGEIEEKVENIMKKLDTDEDKDDGEDIQELINNKLTERESEAREREKRKNNLVIFGIKEPEERDSESRKKADSA